MLLVFTVFTVFVFLCYVILRSLLLQQQIRHRKTGQIMPGPSFFTVLYNTLTKNIPRQKLQYFQQYKSIYQTFNLLHHSITICHSQDLKQLLIQPGFEKHLINIHSRWFHLMGASNMLAVLNGQVWKSRRQILNHAFLDVSQFIPHATKRVEEMIQIWKKDVSQISVAKDLKLLTLDVLGSSIFDREFGLLQNENQDSFLKDFNEFTGAILNPTKVLFNWFNYIPTASNQKLFQQGQRIISYCNELINERRQLFISNTNTEKPTSLIDWMILSKDEQGVGISNEEMITNTFGFLLAGHETTQIALCHYLFFLAKYPIWQQKLEEECSTIFLEKGMTRDDLNQLEWLQYFMKEVLRLSPPIGSLFARVPTQTNTNHSFFFENFEIPNGKNITLDVSIIVIHHNPQIWGEDVEEFKPERFKNRVHVPYSFLPFGLGPRRCIGEAFSWQEQMIVLVYILKHFHIDLAPSFTEMKWDKSIQLLKPHSTFDLKFTVK